MRFAPQTIPAPATGPVLHSPKPDLFGCSFDRIVEKTRRSCRKRRCETEAIISNYL